MLLWCSTMGFYVVFLGGIMIYNLPGIMMGVETWVDNILCAG